MAARVVQKPENSFVQRKCADCEEKEKVQRKSLADGVTPFVQRKVDVGRTLQRKENEEEEPVQTKLIQRKGEEEEEPAQAKGVQRKESEEEEPVQTKLIQRKGEEEEEAAQAKGIQRKESEDEEPVQTKLIQRKETEEEEPVQAKLLSEGGFSTSAIDGPLQDSKGKGSRLSGSVLRDMEAGFGVDLGEVRIHTDQAAVEMNQSVNAQAFTNGWDIYFNQHRFDPGTNEGKFLLAHELTHTIQQAKAKGETLKPALSRAEPEKLAVADEAQAIESAKLQSVEEAAELTAKSSLPPKESSIEKNLPKSLPKKAESKKSPTLPACKPPAKEKGDAVKAPKPNAEATATKNQSAPVGPPTGETKLSIVAQAPKCPANDPAFKKAKSIVRRDAKKQADHEPANKKRTEMVASAALPMAEQNVQSGQEQQAANLEKAASPRPFDRFQFKEKLKLTIASKMPKTEDQAKAFAGSSKLTEAKEEFKGIVSEEKEKISGPLEQTAEQPLPAGKDLKPDNIPIPEAKPGDKPSQVPAGLATPKPRTDSEISLNHKSVELDNQMSREGLTEKQLAESEEPKFEQALQSKKDAQREIAAAPDRYRQIEGQQLEKTSKEADKKTKHELSTMSSTKSEKNREVFGGQTAKETQTEQRQKDIKDQIDGIYNQTKTDVEKILADLSSTVEVTFSREVDQANETFKANVRTRLDEHYGFFTFDDKIAEWAGLSDSVKHIFLEEKELFLYTMDLVLDDIASTVETELNHALQRIQLGRTELENFKKTLSTDELKFAEDLFLEAGDKFNELESSVHESQDDLIESLSDAYVENVSKLQEEFDKIDEELSASWIADAISFIGEVATAINKLGQLLSSIASKIGQYISDILASPKRFFNNLVDGIKGGMDEFRDHIDTYLEQGFWMWLTGASGGTDIQIPKKMDAEGMFSLATQILGLTKEFVLERIKTVLRIPVDAFLALVDKAKEIGGKVLEPVKILINQGIGALWVWVKNEVSGHLTEIFDKLKVEIFQAIIKKFLLWVASLFIPGLGFIKLIQAAYKALRWLVDNIDRIVEIVNTFLDAVGLAVAGNVSAIKGKVVKALTNGVVIAIDFLAKLVGLGNFSDKLQRGIEMLRKPVRKVIDMILIKAKPIVRKIQKAIAKGVAKVKSGIRKVKEKGKVWVDKKVESGRTIIAKLFSWGKTKKQFKTKDGSIHHVFVEKIGNRAKLMVASEKKNAKALLVELSARYSSDKNKLKIIKRAIEITGLIDTQISVIEGLENNLLKSKDDKAARAILGQIQPHYDRLLVLETLLTTNLFDILEADDYKELIKIYAIEGQVGVHNAGPKKRGMFEADHQPSNKILKTAAKEPSAPALLLQIAASRSKWASTITIGYPRHVKGRTWGSKAKGVANEFKLKVIPQLVAAKSISQQKMILETALQREAIEDAKFMINLVNNTPISDDSVWGDINKKPNAKKLKEIIISQIEHGESIIISQKVSVPTKI